MSAIICLLVHIQFKELTEKFIDVEQTENKLVRMSGICCCSAVCS
jgi:hypothetical protein